MLKANLFFLYSITLVAIASLILCIFNYNPYNANTAILIYFYLSLLGSLLGIFTVILFYLKMYAKNSEVVYSLFWPSVRQALLLAIAITAVMLLRGFKLLDFWTGIPIIIVMLLLELFFQTKMLKTND